MGEFKCPKCGHPMVQGPINVRDRAQVDEPFRTASAWCANCHYRIWQDNQDERI